jgi:hypothetical protein
LSAKCTHGTVLANRIVCCNCHDPVDQDDYECHNSDDWCRSCFDDNFTYDELCEAFVPVEDINSYEVYTVQRTIETIYTTEDGIYNRHSRCADGSCVAWCHDNYRIETVDGDYICPDDFDNGDWVETVEGDVMPVGDAYYYDDEYHTDEQETPDDMPEDDSDDSDDEPMAIDPDQIMLTIDTGSGKPIIPAWKVGDFLAVHLRYNESSRDVRVWEVSHIPTGLRIWGNVCETKQAAIDLANKLLASLAIGGIANGMITTAAPNRVDPLAYLESATCAGVLDRPTVNIYRNATNTVDYSVLATV